MRARHYYEYYIADSIRVFARKTKQFPLQEYRKLCEYLSSLRPKPSDSTAKISIDLHYVDYPYLRIRELTLCSSKYPQGIAREFCHYQWKDTENHRYEFSSPEHGNPEDHHYHCSHQRGLLKGLGIMSPEDDPALLQLYFAWLHTCTEIKEKL